MVKPREITVETVADTIVASGIKAAKELLAEKAGALDTAIAKNKATITEAEKELRDLEKQQSMLQTILIGAVKRASKAEGIVLDAPASAGAAKKRTRSPGGLAVVILKALVDGQKSVEAMTTAAAGFEKTSVNSTLNSLKKKGLVKSVARGTYAITDQGKAQLP